MKYSKKILEHFYQPLNVGDFTMSEIASAKILTGESGAISSGDLVKLQLLVQDNIIKDARFKVYGGVVTIACASWITEWLKNKTLDQAKQITLDEIMESLEVPKLKSYAASLVLTALNNIKENG